MQRETFDYQPHNLCGGKARSVVTQGPAPQGKDGLINTKPTAVEGEYVSRKTGRMSILTYMRNAQWAKDQQLNQPVEETVEQWLQRHKIGQPS